MAKLERRAPETAPHSATEPAPQLRWQCASLALLYAAFILYASTIITPVGIHFVPIDPDAAWQRMLALRYENLGDDQRPDWMANLLLLVPLGALGAAAIMPARGRVRRMAAAAAALLLCVAFVMAVKYAQIYFPPRTVNLNYIAAQSLGSLVGVVGFLALAPTLPGVMRALSLGGRHALIVALTLYTVSMAAFMLFRFDITTDIPTLTARAWAMVSQFPGAGQGMARRIAIATMQFLALLPVGALMALWWPRATVARAAARGIGGLASVTCLRLLLGATSPSLLLQAVGLAAGAIGARWVARQSAQELLHALARLVWPSVPLYICAVLTVKDVLHGPWQSFDTAWAALDPRMLLPFFQSYIVSKSHALAAMAVHVAMFAPIGFMVWLRRGGSALAPLLAAFLAAAFALAIEFARLLKPGLIPDFSNAAFAAGGAWAAARLAQTVLPMPRAAPPVAED